MTLLAEIADKMPGIGTIWAIMAILAIAFAAAALCHRRAAIAALPFAATLTVWLIYTGYEEAFVDGSMSRAIREELGWIWIASSLVAPLLPTAAVLAIIYARGQRKLSIRRGFEPLPRDSARII